MNRVYYTLRFYKSLRIHKNKKLSKDFLFFFSLILQRFIILLFFSKCLGLRFVCFCCKDLEISRPFVPEINNSPPIRSSQTLIEDFRLASHLQATRQHIENFNLQARETPSLSMSTPLRSSIALMESQIPRNNHCSTRVTITSSVEQTSIQSPPAYEDLIRRNSIALTLEQESLLPPPTYEDFMQRNNERKT